MATIPKAILDLLTNSKTAKFAESLKHSDLPKGWADDPEIVDLAAKAWQEAGTDSPFFKAWFGGSKVVDDAGKPLQVYHGTPDGGFEEFYPGQTWVTPERRYANEYADKRMYESMADDSFGDYGPGFDVEEEVPEVFELFSKSKNPIDVGEIGFEIDANGINALSKITSIPKSQLNKIAKTNDAKWMWEITGSPDFLEIAQDKGFDGIKALERFNPTYATFEPTQIKSVNNRGTFNPSDPNIYRTVAPFGVGTAAMTAALLGGGDEAKAAAINAALADPASREKAAAAGLPYDPPPTEPVVSPIDILVAPVGAGAGITNKLLAMALEAPVTLGLDAGLSALGGLFGGGDRKKPGGW